MTTSNMNPVNLGEFELRYERRSDGKLYFGKSVTRYTYCLVDPENHGDRLYLSNHELRKTFRSSPKNKTLKVSRWARLGKGRRHIRDKEAFEQYLNQGMEAIS